MTARLSKAEGAKEPAFIELPWPSRALHPNARVHWAAKSKAAKRERIWAGSATWSAGLRKIDAKALQVTVIFNPPDRRHRDLDGMLSALKPALDGVADTIGVDDSKWAFVLHRDDPRPPHGAVLIQIEVLL